MKTAILLALVTLTVLLQIDLSMTRGARVRFSSSSSSSRSSSGYTLVKKYDNYKAAIAAHMTVSGMASYRAKYYGTKKYNDDPTVCYTTASGRYDNGTYAHRLGYFVCPYNSWDKASDTYCCGPNLEQECCGFWKGSSQVGGAIAGISIGSILLLFIITQVVYCVCCKKEKKNAADASVESRESDVRPPHTTKSSVDTPSYSLYRVNLPPIPKHPALPPPPKYNSLAKPGSS